MTGVLIMAGGTGGHVFPGLAVARRLRERNVPVTWLGTRQGLEARLVPQRAPDIAMEWVSIRGVRGGGLLRWLILPAALLRAMWQAWRVIRRRRPGVILSMGGFVAGPGGLIAWLTRTPLVIHEQNAVPGMTNRWLAPFAEHVLTGFPLVFSETARVRHVGNPVREEISQLPDPTVRFADRSGRMRVLVVGGSQGAAVLNTVMPHVLHALAASDRPDVWHQCGKAAPEVERAYGDARARVVPFIDDMSTAYGWADLVICRSGAMTVAELAAVGVGAILVPFQHAVDDHQSANARVLVDHGAGVMIAQSEFTAARVIALLQQFAANRDVLLKMACAARACHIPDADNTVAQLCLEAMDA